MLNQVLQALESAGGPVSLDELSARLGVERGALEGMIAFWVRKGRLRDSAAAGCGAGGCAGCGVRGGACPLGPGGPRVISLQGGRGAADRR